MEPLQLEVPPDAKCAADVTEELQLVARSPGEMKQAQASLAVWCESKVFILQRDLTDLVEALQIACDHGWKTAPLERQVRNAEKRVEFYRKVKAAVDAGYCVVPNMPVDVFAIRTSKHHPWADKPQSSESPDVGEGRYVDSEPTVHRQVEEKDSSGNVLSRSHTFATGFEEVDFPISVARPLVMSATVEAMALKCFDEIGVLPARRGKGDPIVLGIVKEKGRDGRRISFLIAWYVDTRDL